MALRRIALAVTAFAALHTAVLEGAPDVASRTITYVTGSSADPVKHTLDLYRPRARKELPVLLFFHGGVWQMGDKEQYRNVGTAFARRGILTAVVNYRLTPSVRHPGHVRDAARAVAWAVRHTGEFGGRPDRVFLSGHSAGGHLITLLLMDPQYLRAEKVNADSLAGVVPLSGVFDLTKPMDDTSQGGAAFYIHPPFGTDRRGLEAASPIKHLRKTPVPLLVLLAGEDYRAMQDQSQRFVDALRRRNLAVTYEVIDRRGHFEIVTGIGTPDDRTTDLIARFVLGPTAGGPSRSN